MPNVIEELGRSLRELRKHFGVSDEISDPETWPPPAAPLADLRSMFEQQYWPGVSDALAIGLVLPDWVRATWRASSNVGGEFALTNLFLAAARKLDPSLASQSVGGVPLGDTRIVDQIVTAGPNGYVLALVEDNRLTDRLLFFDTRELLELELDFESYLARIALSKGLNSWQRLFTTDGSLSGYERAALTDGLAFLESTFPEWDYADLHRRLSDKGENIVGNR